MKRVSLGLLITATVAMAIMMSFVEGSWADNIDDIKARCAKDQAEGTMELSACYEKQVEYVQKVLNWQTENGFPSNEKDIGSMLEQNRFTKNLIAKIAALGGCKKVFPGEWDKIWECLQEIAP
jgi:hypothetical protein